MSESESGKIFIRHEPYGEQHPYEPLPFERTPRDPCAGEPVTLGIEASREPAPDSVWCTWSVEGSEAEHRQPAAKISEGQSSEIWQAQLPAFFSGEKVCYRVAAAYGSRQVETESYTFGISRWVDAARICSAQCAEDRLSAVMETTRSGLMVHLTAEHDPSGVISFRLSSLSKENVSASSDQKTDTATAAWGNVHMELRDDPVRLIIRRGADGMTLQTSAPIQALVSAEGKVLQYRLHFDSPADEAFSGFGERFNALNQRGSRLDNRVYGQYTHQGKRSYIPIPFFISSRKYGFWLDTDCQAIFDLAAETADCWWAAGQAEGDAAVLNFKLFVQPDPRHAVKAFSELTGKPKLPPAWIFGPWMSSNDWNSQAEVMRQLRLTQEHGIPATVLVIEAWSDEINFYIWNEAQYSLKQASQPIHLKDFTFPADGLWPDPKSMADELHQAGLRLILWQNPAIKYPIPGETMDDRQNQLDQEYAIAQGYVVRKADGSPHRVERHMPWFGNSLVLDFTNPEAAAWWFKKREYLVTEIGVDGFKTDGGEHVWDVHTVYSNGGDGSREINRYPLVYEEAYRKFMEAFRGDDHVLFSRAGYTGAQRNPAHWAGDENSTWDAFRATLYAMLNVGICGVPFFGWDIAGFAGPIPTSELYLRAAAFSVFCPIMQYHSDVNHRRSPSRDRTPWNIQEQTNDPEVVPVYRQFANLRMNLLPYLLSQVYASSVSSLPMMRALFLEYPDDALCRSYPFEYLFGDALLAAPVMEEGRTDWTVYLPEGNWRDFWTGEAIAGPRVLTVRVPRDRIPVYQKQGSIVALNLGESGELCSPVGNSVTTLDHLCLRIFPGGDIQADLSLPVYAAPVRVSVRTDDAGCLVMDLPVLKHSIDLVIYTTRPHAVTINGQTLLETPAGGSQRPCWSWNALREEATVSLSPLESTARVIINFL